VGAKKLLGTLLVVIVAGVASCSSGDDPESASSSGSTTTVEASSAPVSTIPYDPAKTYGVGRREMTFVDDSRGVEAMPQQGREAQPDRALTTIIEFPTNADGDQEPADGAFPLVVFAHGTGGNAAMYAPFLEPLTRKGYIVALPTFPVTSQRGAPLDDARNQPGDVSFVIDELLDESADGDSWLAGHVDPEHIAAAGHSLGAVTTVGLVYDDCCIDDRIDAALVLAGTGVASSTGALDDRPPTPLFLIHGGADNIVPVGGGDDLFAAATGPTYYLRYPNADHFGIAIGDNGPLTTQAVVAFMDAELKDHPEGLAAIPDAVAASTSGVEWKTRNTP
jgi:fermentation-respiration switch protein FrsA (DUF1100 family)